jgi:hypothetical protein
VPPRLAKDKKSTRQTSPTLLSVLTGRPRAFNCCIEMRRAVARAALGQALRRTVARAPQPYLIAHSPFHLTAPRWAEVVMNVPRWVYPGPTLCALRSTLACENACEARV